MESKTPISDFMHGCRTPNTAYTYRAGILRFLDVMYEKQRTDAKATKDEFQEYEKLAAKYLGQKRDHSADLIIFIQKMTEEKKPPMTINIKVQGVREFFIKNEIEINVAKQRQIKKVMPLRARRATNFDFMTTEKIQAILPHLDIRLQTLLLCLASSGARIGEILSAMITDLNLDAKPISIYLRETKTGEPRTIYISQEAGESIKKWLKSRDAYLKMAGERGITLKLHKDIGDDKRIFPFDRTSVYRSYDAALQKAGLYHKDGKTDRNTLNIHRLRQFFRNAVEPIVGRDDAELLIGHIDQYGNSYRDRPRDELAQRYLLCETALTISGNLRIKHDVEEQGKTIQQLQKENAELKEKLGETSTSQTSEIEALKKQMDKLRNQFRRELTEVVTSLRFEHDTEKMVQERAKEIHADKVDKITTGRKGKGAPISQK